MPTPSSANTPIGSRDPLMMDGLGQNVDQPIHEARPLFRVSTLLEIHGTLDVGEQDGQLLALSLQRGPGPSDRLGQVRWRRRDVGGVRGDREGSGLANRCAALDAEPRPGDVLMSAGPAVHVIPEQE